jgi:ParB/RepB/Spo0J family partition protein
MQSPMDRRNALLEVPVDHIRPDEGQSRKTFDEAQIEELAASVRQVGILEPLELRSDEGRRGHYVIVYGERRWRAARLAGLATVPAFIDRGDGGVRRRQLYENVVRVDLNVVELAANVAAVLREEALDTKALAEQLHWPLRKIQRLVEIDAAPSIVKNAVVKGIDIEGGRRTLSLRHALDVVRAYRHYASVDDSESKDRAVCRLERLVGKVLKEDWSAQKVQEYVSALGRSPKRDPIDRIARAAHSEARSVEVAREASVAVTSPAGNGATTKPLPLFEARGDRFTVFVARARETKDAQARAALAEAVRAIASEFAS